MRLNNTSNHYITLARKTIEYEDCFRYLGNIRIYLTIGLRGLSPALSREMVFLKQASTPDNVKQ